MRTPAMLVMLALAPAPADAAAPCPAWRERQTMACMRGYLRVDPVGLAVHLDRKPWVFDMPGERLGYAPAVGAGMFRSFGNFGLAVGGRFAYALHRYRTPYSTDIDHQIHAGPEVRLGVARERVFGYALVRGGYSRLSDELRVRTTYAPPDPLHVGHVGLGAGAWGRVGRRFLVGGEVAFDALIFDTKSSTALTFSLTLGSWL